MRFQYCPQCGTKLYLKPIGDEGEVPWCEQCKRPLFDMFATCIIALVINSKREVAVLRQGYLSQQYGCLVSGFMKPGETAEECAAREIQEELGLRVKSLALKKTYWKPKGEQLMISFFAYIEDDAVRLSQEVDSMKWEKPAEALLHVHPEGSISYAVVEQYLNEIQ